MNVVPGGDDDACYERAAQNFIDGGKPDETVMFRDSCWMCHGIGIWRDQGNMPCIFCAGKGYFVGER